jgi:hypothetical protein
VLYARRRDAPPPKLRMLPLLLALLALAARAEAQGLKVGGVQGLGAQRSYQSLSSMLAAASSFRSEYKQDKQGACSQDSESLCSKRSSFDDLGVLHLATSPQAFDARTKEVCPAGPGWRPAAHSAWGPVATRRMLAGAATTGAWDNGASRNTGSCVEAGARPENQGPSSPLQRSLPLPRA